MHQLVLPSRLITLTASLLFSSVATIAQTATVRVDPSSTTVLLSNSINLEVVVENVTDLHAARVEIAFAGSVLLYTGVSSGDLLGRSGSAVAFFSNPPPNSGTNTLTVDQAILSPNTVSGSGILFSIEFTALASGSTLVEITDLDLRDGADPPANIPAFHVSGQVMVNAPPVIASQPPLITSQGQVYEYRVLAFDPEGDALSFSLPLAPAFLSIAGSTGTICGTPGNADVGEHAVTVQVCDNRGGTDAQSYVLMVLNVNDPPETFALLEPADGDILELVFPPVQVEFHWEASIDPDPNDAIVYVFHLMGPKLDTTLIGLDDTSLSLDLMSRFWAAESYRWHVLATDGRLATSSDTAEFFTSDEVLGLEENKYDLDAYALYQNYPNPFNPATTIEYRLPNQSDVTLIVYDVLGMEIITLVRGNYPEGIYEVVWNGLDRFGTRVRSGIYLYRLEGKTINGDKVRFAKVRKMIFLK